MALNSFLRARKALVLGAISGSSKSGSNSSPSPSIALVMGNEAGDADSLACAVGFAFLASRSAPSNPETEGAAASVARHLALPWTPFIQTRRSDLHLRRENELALQVAGINADDLLWLDELDTANLRPVGKDSKKGDVSSEAPVSAALAMVDHNKLSTNFGVFGEESVSAVIDHHADEELYKTASPRVIVPPTQAGSCASVLTDYFRSHISADTMPAELATLLLSAIIIDTHNLDPKVAKARAVDESAVKWLWPLSNLALGKRTPSTAGTNSAPASSPGFTDLQSYHDALSEAKEDISTLNTRDLIRRDYKSYSLPSSDGGKWSVGLTSVPLGLQAWIDREPVADSSDAASSYPFLDACDAFCAESHLDLLGLLCTFTDPTTHKFRRLDFLYAPSHSALRARELIEHLQHPPPVSGGEDVPPELGLEPYEAQHLPSPAQEEGAYWVALDQTALKATRKQFAPAIKAAARATPAPESRNVDA